MSTETARLEAFSDGVFAIAITLLILEIKVPAAGTGMLAAQLLRQWPSYFSFAASFIFIGIMWINHHRLFTHIRKCDDLLLIFNLLLLMGITFVPFPTAVLAAHLGGQDQRSATIFFQGTYFLIALLFNLLWRYAAWSRRLLSLDTDSSLVTRITRQYSLGPLLYLVCLALAWVNVPASLLLNLSLAFFFAFPAHRSRKLAGLRN